MDQRPQISGEDVLGHGRGRCGNGVWGVLNCRFGCVVFVFHLICKAEEVTEGGGDQRTSGRIQVEDRSLRQVCQNVVVLSSLLLSYSNNYRLCQVIFAVGEPVKDWHAYQSSTLKTGDAGLAFFYDQIVKGGFCKSACSIISKLFSTATLERCGFIVSSQARVLTYVLIC